MHSMFRVRGSEVPAPSNVFLPLRGDEPQRKALFSELPVALSTRKTTKRLNPSIRSKQVQRPGVCVANVGMLPAGEVMVERFVAVPGKPRIDDGSGAT
jgi:hypothetical protein